MATAPVKKPVTRSKPGKTAVVPTKKIVAAAAKATVTKGKARAKPAASQPKAPARKAAPAKKPATAKPMADAAKDKQRKTKLVRDSFTMPEAEYAVLGRVKKACISAGVEVKKSQLLRIGLALLDRTDLPSLKGLIAGLAPLKAGRPKKEK